jgi:hypothetical protein
MGFIAIFEPIKFSLTVIYFASDKVFSCLVLIILACTCESSFFICIHKRKEISKVSVDLSSSQA